MMHDAKVGPVSAEQKEFLGDILTSSRHLLQLINDVLDLAKVESGTMAFHHEAVDVGTIVGEVRDILRSLAAAKRIPVSVDVVPSLGPVEADAGKLKQILYNYVSNALKFTPDGGRVSIRVEPEGADAFRIEVADTGPGIRPEDISRLFVEFQQLDASAAKRHAGTGLGLALTKRIVEAQGGRIGVRTAPGEGSVFFAVLPRRKPAEAPAEVVPSPRPGAPVVLVVEDDARDRAWLVQTLLAAGYGVEAASTGAAAILRARQRSFDAITLDLLLPDMSGRDVLSTLRASGPNRRTPVVVVTVVAEKEVVAGFRVHDFLSKPVRGEDLVAALASAGVARDDRRPVLVVDDDPNALKLAEGSLRDLGYRPVCFEDPEAGLEAALGETPAAVILDLRMPGLSGFEFLRRLRERPGGKHVSVIVWTAMDVTRPVRAELLRLAQGVVAKAEGARELLEELRAVLPEAGGEG
jgi:CheY-like chemotaxis protein/two-component sensor histidine kinase